MAHLKYKIIKDIKQYNQYCDIYESLFGKESDIHLDELELLELLIEDYENKQSSRPKPTLNPVELLKSLMENSSISQAQLASTLGVSRQLINDVLKYRRNISKELVVKLSGHFKMRQEAFSRSYELKNEKKKADTSKNATENIRTANGERGKRRDTSAPFHQWPSASHSYLVFLPHFQESLRQENSTSLSPNFQGINLSKEFLDNGNNRYPMGT